MASDFQIPEDIANRALQHIGAERITSFTDASKAAAETSFCYNKLRQSELRRNEWRFSITRTVLRVIDSDTKLWTPPTYAAGTTYQMGAIVLFTDSYGKVNIWRSRLVNNLGNTPGATTGPYAAWTLYAASLYAYRYDSAESYYSGEMVYEQTAFNTFNIFQAKMQTNADDPATTDTYSASVTYGLGDIAAVGAQNYVSLAIENLGNTPASSPTYWATTALTGSNQWLLVNGTIQEVPILYPVGTGPADQTFTKNIYPLPVNYLGKANQDPKAGGISILGSPTNAAINEWEMEGGFIVSQFMDPLFFRFKADVTDVTLMDALFCEGLACRIALEVCEPITQANEKMQNVTREYMKFMGEARTINAIEIGPVEPEIDDYLSCRL